MTDARLDHEAEPEDSQEIIKLRSSFEDLYKLYERKENGTLPDYEFEYYLIQKAGENKLKPDEYKPLFRAYRIEKEGKSREGKLEYLFFWTERKLESLSHALSEMDAFQVAEYVLKAIAIGSIALGFLSFFLEGAKREEQRSVEADRKEIEAEQKEISQRRSLYEAWQTITTTEGKSANAGRREALEVLMKSGVNLEAINLENATLSFLSLAGANLPNAQLRNLSAYQINLEKTNLQGSDLRGAYLGQANLHYADMQDTFLCPSPLDSSKKGLSESGEHCKPPDDAGNSSTSKTSVNQTPEKQNVNLSSNLLATTNNLKSSASKVHEPTNAKAQTNSNLSSAKANTTNSKNTITSDASKGGVAEKQCPWSTEKYLPAQLTKADLREAHLGRADLRCASLDGTNLSNADLVGAKLNFTDFSGAILFGSTFGKKDKAMLEEATLKGALYDKETQFPFKFDPKGAGAVEFKAGGELKPFEPQKALNLKRANLRDIDLQGMHFIDVILEKAVLDGSNLTKTEFRSSSSQVVKMGNANFRGANLSEAKFVGNTILEKANFSGARLEGTILKDAKLCGAKFQGAIYDDRTKFPEFTRCPEKSGKPKEKFDKREVGAYKISELKERRDLELKGSNLSKLDLKNVDWTGVNLHHANLQGADLSGANLSGADLSGADLTCIEEKACTKLTGANLTGADLRNAKLDGADLSGAILNYAILNGASLKDTKLNGASLRYTELKEAVDLTAQQVRVAQSIDKAKYKNDLRRKLRCHYALEWLFTACIASSD